jgi:hypothetical protein
MLGLLELVALMPSDFAVQIVAFVAEQFVVVEFEAQQMAAAVGQPADAMAVGPRCRDAVVQHVVFMLPNRNQRLLQAQVVLVLAHEIAGRVMKPLQATRGVGGSD